MRRIDLDYAATAPLRPEVAEAMGPWLDCGNPSSLHREGRRAKQAIDEAREAVSGALDCLFAEVLFTSGGVESCNLAILGAALAHQGPRRRILLGAAEHHAVLRTQPILCRLGYQVELIPVDRIARIELDRLESMMGDDVLLVSVMSANNELGAIQPVAQVAEIGRRGGALVHCDAVASFGPVPEADLVSYSAHKIGGPKGVGAILIRAGTRIEPWMVGGGQEREMRAGTENVAAIVGFGVAARLPHRIEPIPRDAFLDRLLEAGFVASVPRREDVLPGHAHVRRPGSDAETMLIRLDRAGIGASSGAACSSGSLEPSHVLLACGYSPAEARECLRFTFGPSHSVDDAEEAASRVIAEVSAHPPLAKPSR